MSERDEVRFHDPGRSEAIDCEAPEQALEGMGSDDGGTLGE